MSSFNFKPKPVHYQLGTLIRSHPYSHADFHKKVNRIRTEFIIILAIALYFTFVIFMLFDRNLLVLYFIGIPFFLYLVLPLLLFLLWNWIFLRSFPKGSLYIYEHGLVFASKKTLYTWRWENITKVFEGIHVNYQTRYVSYAFRLERHNGESILFYNFLDNPEEAFTEICQHVYPPQFEAGQTIGFGAISVNKTELCIKNKRIPWSNIKRMYLSFDAFGELQLYVERFQHRFFGDISVPVDKITNLRLLQFFVACQMSETDP